MTPITRRALLGTVLCALMLVQKSKAQSIIDPSDPVVEYDPAHPPTPPDFFNPLVKWVRTLNIENGAVQYQNPGWTGETNYKAYNYNGLSFRVDFPKTYNPTANDGKKYPIIIFLHGQGENDVTYLGPPPPGSGSYNYDNEWQLLQGPPQFDNAIQNGTYDGYVLAPQLQDPASGPREVYYAGILNDIMNIVKYMINHNKVDPYHIVVNGLSEGGLGSWDILHDFPTYFAAVTPMSSPIIFNADSAYVSNKRFVPIWTSQGGLDNHPTPAQTKAVADSFHKYGGNFTESIYPDNGHNTWYNFWGEPNFWPFINSAYSSNPWMLYGFKNPWPGEPISDTIGLTPGFAQYQWRLNGSVISGAGNNTLHVTAPGLYEARVLRDSVWSDWSHVPINIRPGFYEAESYVNKSSSPQAEHTIDSGGGYDMGYIGNGDWMDYTLNVYAPGTYTLLLRVAASGSGGVMEIRNSDSAVLAPVNVTQTGGFQNWITMSTTVTFASAGVQNIRLKSTSNVAWNINWFQFTLPSNSPLPVKFEYLGADCRSGFVNLQWKTAQEQNTSRFSVQRSVNGNSWNEIGSVAAAGQSSVERSYVFVDRTASSTNLYRVVEYDLNGQTTISSIVRSSCGVQSEVHLYPNPNKGNSALSIPLTQTSNVKVQVMDSKGAIIQQKQILLPAGNNTVPINISSYPDGVYSVRVQYNTETKTIKMIKQ